MIRDIPHIKSEERAAGRGVLVFLTLLTLTACAGAGGGDSPAAATPAPAGPTQRQMTFVHGLGFVCWVTDAKDALWCWLSDPLAETNGDGAKVGLTSVVPALLVTDVPGHVNAPVTQDHAVFYLNHTASIIYVQGLVTGSTVNTYEETVTCDISTPDTVTNCPESVSQLTFPGVTL